MLVNDFLTRSAERFPDKTAVVCAGERISYADLDAHAGRFAAMLAGNGVRRGDRVALLLDNSIDAAVAIFGTLKAGAIFIVVSQTIKADKLEFILADSGATALVTQPVFLDVVRRIDGKVSSLTFIGVCSEDSTVSDLMTPAASFNPRDAGAPAMRAYPPQIDVDVAALIYTSGSTGFPKGVTVSHRNVISAAASITEYLENVADDIIINVLPFSFDYGLYQLLMAVKVGATLVLEKSFAYPFKVVERVYQERVTGFPGVPTIFAVLLQMADLDRALLESVRYVTNTAAALPPHHIDGLRSLFKNARIFSMYGLTECKRVSYLPPEELDRRPTSVGKGMPNTEIFVVDDDGRPLPPGEVGELVVRGSNVMLGYWNRPQETAEVIRPGRYPWERMLHTGDLFKMDDEGFFYFVARKDEIIKSRGEKVSPVEVERIIHELDQVLEVAVIGVPDPILGEALKALIVRAEGCRLSERDVIVHCSRRLESFMVPKEVEFTDSLPKTSSGKIARKEIQKGHGNPSVDGGAMG